MTEDNGFFEKVSSERAEYGEKSRSYAPAVDAPSPPGQITPIDGVRRWAGTDTKFWGAKETYDALPAGLYRCNVAQGLGFYLEKQIVDTDALFILPDTVSQTIVAEFRRFWELRSEFEKRGFLHKRGLLLWGPPGSGKTSLIQLLVKIIVGEMDGVVLFIENPQIAAGCLQMARKIEPVRPLICVMEDLDALVGNYGEHEFLALLDGESQVSNVVFIGTTNYPERLDRRFVDRPSRFDRILYVGMPSASARREYLSKKAPDLSAEELAQWVKLTENFSVAHLREMIIAVRCFEQPVDEVAARLRRMTVKQPSSHTVCRETPGFVNGHADQQTAVRQ